MVSGHLLFFENWLLSVTLFVGLRQVLLMAMMSKAHSEVYCDQIPSLVFMVWVGVRVLCD